MQGSVHMHPIDQDDLASYQNRGDSAAYYVHAHIYTEVGVFN